MKRRRSSVDIDLDTPVESLSKKPRRGKATDPSDEEELGSSPVASSPIPPRLSPPPEEVKEVTTGVKEIDLDNKPGTPLSDPSDVVEPPVILDAETPVESEDGVTANEDISPEQRSEEENASGVEESQDPIEGDSTDENPVNLEDTAKVPGADAKPFAADPIEVPQSKSTGPLTPEGEPEVET